MAKKIFCDICNEEMPEASANTPQVLRAIGKDDICAKCLESHAAINQERMWVNAVIDGRPDIPRCTETGDEKKPYKCPHCGKFISGGKRV